MSEGRKRFFPPPDDPADPDDGLRSLGVGRGEASTEIDRFGFFLLDFEGEAAVFGFALDEEDDGDDDDEEEDEDAAAA